MYIVIMNDLKICEKKKRENQNVRSIIDDKYYPERKVLIK